MMFPSPCGDKLKFMLNLMKKTTAFPSPCGDKLK